MAENNFKHIVRVANVDLPGEKQVSVALTKIKGVGINLASVICSVTGVTKTQKTGDLSDSDIKKLTEVINNPKEIPSWLYNRKKDFESGIDKHVITGNLHFVHDNDLKRLKKIKSNRGLRHQKKLPVRGQRTRSNFRRSKGKVVGVAKKKAPETKKSAGAKK